MRLSLERQVRASNLGPIKSDTVLPTARHRSDTSSNGAASLGRNNAEVVPANSLHASAYYSQHNERFNLQYYDLAATINNFLVEKAQAIRSSAMLSDTMVCEANQNKTALTFI